MLPVVEGIAAGTGMLTQSLADMLSLKVELFSLSPFGINGDFFRYCLVACFVDKGDYSRELNKMQG